MRINEILNEGLNSVIRQRAKDNFNKKRTKFSDHEIDLYLTKWGKYFSPSSERYLDILELKFDKIKDIIDEIEERNSRISKSAYMITTISEARKVLSTGRLPMQELNKSGDQKLEGYKYRTRMYTDKKYVLNEVKNKDSVVVLRFDISTNYFGRKTASSKDYEIYETERPIYDSATGYFYSTTDKVPIDRFLVDISYLFDSKLKSLDANGILDLVSEAKKNNIEMSFYSIHSEGYTSSSKSLKYDTALKFLTNLDNRELSKPQAAETEFYPRDCRDILYHVIGKKSSLSDGAELLLKQCIEDGTMDAFNLASTWSKEVSRKDKDARLDMRNFMRRKRFSPEEFLSFLADEINKKYNSNIKVNKEELTEARLLSPTKKNIGNLRKLFNKRIPISKSKEIIGEFIKDDDLFAILDNEMNLYPEKDARPIIADWIKMNIPGIAKVEDDEYPSGLFSAISSHPEAKNNY